MPPEPDPPYLRIVTEIRRRIADGELAPGDRVPSTRQIAKEWGVALATATKALTTLRLEGLVEARPRVGTVVATRASSSPVRRTTPPPPPPSPPGPEHELTRERIVRAAIEIADSEGLAALSMRGVAARLGVAAMSPYRHIGSKEDLVLLMADTAFGEKPYPADPPPGWRPRLELAARTLWARYRNHPWLAQTGPLTRPLLLPNLMVHAEWVLAALDDHGLDPTAVLDLHVLLYSYVQGIAANLEQEAQAEAATGLSEDEWMDRQSQALQAITTSPRYPTFTRLTASLPNGYDLRLDELFEFGLGPLLDGVAVIIEGR
ncbi:GntR family transcriptional regulator [Streptomyces sp. ME19-01-6]|uniref:GntR family transcriptional regulator n=1 Tax=Streptomyces sp. ME19-01-6 TaxID=3028686 RepID=UPI0029BED202|nr:GntR family transcriptional regulator [Streptomyces sp. ME19-01-6]MDX3232133.1 TetR/AcrR family transcriptional regulator C-terminal domain-containing protein [Streptomyces sp. ME19-01-6]